MWLNPTTQAVYRTFQELRAAWPNTSLPSRLSDAALNTFGLATIQPAPLPEFDPTIQAVEEGAPREVNGRWTQQWIVRELTAEEFKARVPQEVTALQGLLAIDAAGLASAYETWASDPARTFAQRAFISRAQTWRRDDPTLQAAATDLGLTESQLDDLFTLAATL